MNCYDNYCGEPADYVVTCFDKSTMYLCAWHTLTFEVADKMVGNYPLIESTKPIKKDTNQ